MASLDADRQQALQAAERQQAALGAERQIADREMQAAFQEGEAERDQVRAQSTTQSLTPEAPRRSSIMGLGAGLGGFARRDATPGSEPVGRHGIVGGTGKLMQGLVGGTVSGIMGGTNLVIQGTGMVVQGTGKVIQGTGNVVVQGTGKVIKGTGDVTMKVMRGTGDLTMKVVQGTGDLTMKVVQGTGDVAVNVLTLGNKQIVSTMNKADILYQSPVSKSLTWEEEVVLSTKTMGDAVQRAKFLLVEVWDKNTMADACLGECFLPIISAAQEPSEGEGGDGGASASSVGGQKYPLQISKHMKRSRAVGSASAALGSVTVQLTRKDLPTKMKDDLVAVNMVLQLKPIGALDFAWPCRLLTAGQAADALEDDQLHMQLGHTGLHIRTPLVQPYSDRALLLMECLERVPGDELELVVPYSQIIGGVCTILTTDALICGITLTRSVPSGTVKNTRVERPVTLDLLVGPCPAADVFTIIRQRTALHSICTTVKHLAGVTTSTTELNAVAKELAADIYATSRFIESLSAEIDTSALLENMGAGNVGTDSESTRLIQKVNSERSTSGAIFSDSHNRMSITYHRATLPLRVLTVRRALLRVYFWFLLEFSKTVAADVQNGEVRQNVDVQFNIGYVSILNHRARCTLKYGDPEHVNDGSDSDDDEYGGPGEKGEGPDTGSLVTRVVGIMEKLDQDARALLFQAYRKNLPRSEVEVLLNKMIYEQYIVIVSYLVDKLLDGDAREEDEEESEGSARGSVHGGEAHGVLPAHLSTKAQIQALIQAQALAQAQAALPTPPARGPLSPGLARFSSIASSVARGQVSQVARMATAVGDALQMQKMQAKLQALDKTDSKATRELAAQESHRKHDLISFVLSQDNLFVLYLNATLHAFDFTFRIPPYLSICLDFDLLIVRFSDNINENIQMWNSKALKVFMKGDERTSRVPWDVTTMDEATGNQLFISHIPESIQIQLNVQIGLKKIQTTGMGDNLSLLSIRRIQEINIKVARSIAKAYLALALEYETFLLDAIADTTTTPGKGDSSGGLSSLLNTGINLGARGVDMTVGLLGVRRAAVALQEHTAEEVDEFLCFLMSVVNDCTRLIAEHIPYTVSGFTKEFSEDEDALHAHTKKSSLGLTASEEIHSFYFNPIKAIKSVSRTATNILSNQVHIPHKS
ncbi:hypothetical protein B484DRAFT_143116 [Ochromonadaceae sp. CCMP2298]|nr:hypothetical protein B484DRAFT_143116 [Ochromonadaceae sp. CCMP2298]